MLGTLPGYWLGADNGRTNSPFLPKALWHQRLLEASFSGADIVLDDYPEPASCTTLIVSCNTSGRVDQSTVNGVNSVNGPNGVNGANGVNGSSNRAPVNGTNGVRDSTVTLVKSPLSPVSQRRPIHHTDPSFRSIATHPSPFKEPSSTSTHAKEFPRTPFPSQTSPPPFSKTPAPSC